MSDDLNSWNVHGQRLPLDFWIFSSGKKDFKLFSYFRGDIHFSIYVVFINIQSFVMISHQIKEIPSTFD